ncbi:MAG: hypothetical protein R3C16_03455 [Hyphomonadaceae bacterium]
MTDDLQPTTTSSRGDALFVLALFAIALATASYFANPAFATQVDGLKDWAMSFVS